MSNASHDGFDHPPVGWQAMVNEVQSRVDGLDAALANLRVALSHLTLSASYEEAQTPSHEVEMAPVEWSSSALDEEAMQEPGAPAFDQEAAREEVRRAVEQARNDLAQDPEVSSLDWTMPRDVWPGWSAPQVTDEDPMRDEVRRAVEEAKAELARGELSPESSADDWVELSSDQAEMATESQPQAAAIDQPETESDFDDLAIRESIRLAVERAKTAMTNGAHSDSDAEDWREAELAAQDMSPAGAMPDDGMPQTSADTTSASVDEPEQDETPDAEEAARESVRLAVERAKAGITNDTTSDPEAEDGREPDSDEDAREEVRRAVAQLRNEFSWGAASVSFDKPNGDEAQDDEEAKRDDVRRAVEQARSEMTFVGGLSMYDDTAPPEADGLKPEETQSLFAAFAGADSPSNWEQREPELLGLPASIVIEDEEGRVELARVYDTLNRVDRSQAALLNYSPHSVTVGLASREPLPEPDVMVAAVKDAFGRTCRVSTDGVKMSVKIGDEEKAA